MTKSVPDPLPPGYTVGAYKIESELPAAGMGRVYKAVRITGWHEVVAINVLSPALRDPENVGRFFWCCKLAWERATREGTSTVLNIFDIEGVIGVVVGYTDASGPATDVANEWSRPTRG